MSVSLGIIGTGNVGTSLYNAFTAANVEVTWYSRLPKSEEQKPYADTTLKDDVILLAVPDDHIETLARQIKVQDHSIVCHVSGATPIGILQNHFGVKAGVFYPLQTIRKDAVMDWKNIPICLECIDEKAYLKLQYLAELISEKVYAINSDQRIKLHLAAVMLNNFGNHLAVLTRDYLKDASVDFSLLHGLIEESAAKLLKGDFGQTGPAIRGDIKTMERHKALLSDYPGLRELYDTISKNIQAYYNNKS